MSKNRALLFDLDGVLVDSTAAYRQAWAAWAHAYGVDERAIWEDAHGQRPEDIIRRVRPNITPSAALDDFDRALADAILLVRALPGAGELVRQLGWHEWAIVTSGRREQVLSMLATVGIAEPPVLVCGQDTSAGKPHPECLLLAAHQLRLAASRCTVIADAPVGVQAAQSADMPVIGLTSTHTSGVLPASRTFPSLAEATPVLLEWLRTPA